jgi:hypothetical protein
MRAMRHLIALCALVAVTGCGNEGNHGPDMSMPLDLTPGPDIAVRTPDGVACGGTTVCPVGTSCCISSNGTMVTGTTCVTSANMCMGALLACDGPEDCSGMQYCCGTIMFNMGGPDGGGTTFQGGNSMCNGTCNFNFGGNSVTTRLCQADVDCAGLTIPLVGTQTTCCSSAMAPGLHFCAAAFGGMVTCP